MINNIHSQYTTVPARLENGDVCQELTQLRDEFRSLSTAYEQNPNDPQALSNLEACMNQMKTLLTDPAVVKELDLQAEENGFAISGGQDSITGFIHSTLESIDIFLKTPNPYGTNEINTDFTQVTYELDNQDPLSGDMLATEQAFEQALQSGDMSQISAYLDNFKQSFDAEDIYQNIQSLYAQNDLTNVKADQAAYAGCESLLQEMSSPNVTVQQEQALGKEFDADFERLAHAVQFKLTRS